MFNKIDNFGLIDSSPKPNDWEVGGFTPLGRQSLNSYGDWTEFLPLPEYQNNNFDRLACVSYSLLNCLEILYKFLTQTDRNFSDRFLAKMSRTTKEGNTLERVFDTARDIGLVDEVLWADVNTNWDDYYQEIPINIINEAYEFKNDWSLYREWVNPYEKDLIYNSLKDAPLQITVAYTTGEGILKPTGRHNHAVCLFNAEYGKYWEIFDHYTQTIKKYHWDYVFGAILKPTLNRKNIMFLPNDNELYLLVEGKSQVLAMGWKGKLMIYADKIDTLLNSASRSNKYQIPKPITLEQYNSVDKVNGKGEPIQD